MFCLSLIPVSIPYESSGLKLPNFYSNFFSSQLPQIKQCFLNTSFSLKRIGSLDICPYNLKDLPYIYFDEVDKITKNVVILKSLHFWKLTDKLLGYKNPLPPFLLN